MFDSTFNTERRMYWMKKALDRADHIAQLKAENERLQAWWNVAVAFIGKKTLRMGDFIEFINKNDQEELEGVFEALGGE